MKVLNRPILAPGKCINCGVADNDDGRTFIDLSFSLPRYGRVYFCSECIVEVFEVMGYVSNAHVANLKEEFEELRVKYVELLRVHTDLKGSIKIVLAHCDPSSTELGDSGSGISPVDSNEGTTEVSVETTGDDSEPSEFDGLEGFGSIHSDSGDD